MKEETNKNIETSIVLGNDIRWEMVAIAGQIKAQRFKFWDIVDKEKLKRSERMQKFSLRWLQECFRQLIESGVFVKVKGKYLYELNRKQIIEHAEAVESLTTNKQ